MDVKTDEYLTCPFNISHQILASRMQSHLVRCSQQYNQPMPLRCPYNSTHYVLVSESEHHSANCKDRITMDRYVFREESSTQHIDLPALQNLNLDSSENWENNSNTPTYDPIKKLQEKEVVVCTRKSESYATRRNHRIEQKLRIQSLAGMQSETASRNKTGTSGAMARIPDALRNVPQYDPYEFEKLLESVRKGSSTAVNVDELSQACSVASQETDKSKNLESNSHNQRLRQQNRKQDNPTRVTTNNNDDDEHWIKVKPTQSLHVIDVYNERIY